MIRYTLLIEEDRQRVTKPGSGYVEATYETETIEEDRQRVTKPGSGYVEATYETETIVLAKIEGETLNRGTALDAIAAVAKDLQLVKATVGHPVTYVTGTPNALRVENS